MVLIILKHPCSPNSGDVKLKNSVRQFMANQEEINQAQILY